MQKYIIAAVITIFSLGVAVYLLQNLNPLNMNKLQPLIALENVRSTDSLRQLLASLRERGIILDYVNTQNLMLLVGTMFAGIVSLVTLIHMLIEKVTLRKFYEDPSLPRAIRRGVWVALSLLSTALYLSFAAEWYLMVMTWLLIWLLELIISKALDKRGRKEDEVEMSVEEMEAAARARKIVENPVSIVRGLDADESSITDELSEKQLQHEEEEAINDSDAENTVSNV